MSMIGLLTKAPLNRAAQPSDDARTRRALQKRQALQEEFTQRILNPKVRMIGIDKNALDAQVEERKLIHSMEKERESFLDNQALAMDAHAQHLQHQSDQIRHEREVNVNHFRQTYQQKEFSREWDLQDPKRILNALPARTRDDDIRCGPASVQKFEGEDLDAKCRRRAQALQQQRWAEEQVMERRMRDLIRREYDVAMDRCSEEMAQRAFEIQSLVAQQRRASVITTTQFNAALAKQKEEEKKRIKLQETMASIEEVHNMLNSDFLAESQGTREKGLKGVEKSHINLVQQRQREEVQQKKVQEAEQRRQDELRDEMERRMAVALDRQRERERREELLKLNDERKRQMAEKECRGQKIKELYTPAITEGFFDKFGLGRKF